MTVVSNISEIVGKTPLVKLSRIVDNPKVDVYVKLESQNPGGSVKDRPVLSMLLEAEKSGELQPFMKIIEPTSGNTGIALAMMAKARGYELELVMPENSTPERIKLMTAYGAKVTLTSEKYSMEGAIDYTHEKYNKHKSEYYMPNQFANYANPLAHYKSTGPEIWEDTKGKITHFVSAMGTTGTIMGTSRFLKAKKKDIKIIGVKPKEGASIPGIRRWPCEYLPKIFDSSRVDEEWDVSQEDSEVMSRRLSREEGILCGMSAGGAVAISLKLASELREAVIVTIVCDRGDRYLSSSLFC